VTKDEVKSECDSSFLSKCVGYLVRIIRMNSLNMNGKLLEVDLTGDNAFYS